MNRNTYFNTLLVIFIISIVISNVVGARIITVGISVAGIELATSGGAITYAFTFLCTDIIGELWGKRKAMEVVKYGFIGQVFALVMITLTGWCKAVDPAIDEAYMTLLSQSWSFCLGSICAYYVSQTWDVEVFHRIKGWWKGRLGRRYNGEGRWIWNNVSTCTSQVWDTVVYATIAFGIGQGWFFDLQKFRSFLGLCAGQYLLKFCIAILDTPFFYLLTSRAFRRVCRA